MLENKLKITKIPTMQSMSLPTPPTMGNNTSQFLVEWRSPTEITPTGKNDRRITEIWAPLPFPPHQYRNKKTYFSVIFPPTPKYRQLSYEELYVFQSYLESRFLPNNYHNHLADIVLHLTREGFLDHQHFLDIKFSFQSILLFIKDVPITHLSLVIFLSRLLYKVPTMNARLWVPLGHTLHGWIEGSRILCCTNQFHPLLYIHQPISSHHWTLSMHVLFCSNTLWDQICRLLSNQIL